MLVLDDLHESCYVFAFQQINILNIDKMALSIYSDKGWVSEVELDFLTQSNWDMLCDCKYKLVNIQLKNSINLVLEQSF